MKPSIKQHPIPWHDADYLEGSGSGLLYPSGNELGNVVMTDDTPLCDPYRHARNIRAVIIDQVREDLLEIRPEDT